MDSSGKKLTKSSIFRCGLPIELMNELFASLPFQNAFCLLARMPNGLLARNLQKMFKGIKMAMKNNKLNEQDCGPKLTISEGGLVLKHCGPKGGNCVRAVLPIPAFNLKGINNSIIAFYFEVQILDGYGGCFTIGFCEQQFPLEWEWEESKWLGRENNSNSIGINSKRGIWIDGSWIEFKNVDGYFKKDDFVGFGIIHHKNSETECFVTWNCQLMGRCKLPSSFANLQLFPAVNLFVHGSIHLNFGKEKWQFKEFGCVLKK